jgi:glycerol-3-phosphate acyltransferase PlsY
VPVVEVVGRQFVMKARMRVMRARCWVFDLAVASIAAAVTLPMAVALTLAVDSPVFYVALVVALFVVWSHRANIARLRAGTEPKTFGKKEVA